MKQTGRKLSEKQKKQVLRIVKTTAGIRTESKHHQVIVNPTAIDAVGIVSKLSAVPAGINDEQRVGDEIFLQNLKFRYIWYGGDATNILRFVIFRWRDSDVPGAPVITDVLQTTNAMSYYNDLNYDSGRVQILYDNLAAYGSGGSQTKAVDKTIYGKTLGKKRLMFSDVSAVTGPEHIYFLALTDSVAASHPTLVFRSRLYFTDA